MFKIGKADKPVNAYKMRKYGKKKSRQVDNTGSPPGAIGDLTLMLNLEE